MKTGKGLLAPFTDNHQLESQRLFEGERFPNTVVTPVGTLLATWGKETFQLRRSEDGGATWGPIIDVVTPGFHGGGVTVDERRERVLIFVEPKHPPKGAQTVMGPLQVFQSQDDGKTWQPVEVAIHPDVCGHVPARHMSEHGIMLRHGSHTGRLLRGTRVYQHAAKPADSYASAIYSDDGGRTWYASDPFPVTGTGESALAELSTGDIYHSARRNYFDTEPEDFHHRRHAAWSRDGGATWEDPHTDDELPDGPRYRGDQRRGANYNGHFGMLAGLVRLPVEGRDILLYSNADTSGHERVRGSVWASFDGGKTWPVKRLVQDGPFAYSSLSAGWQGTPSEGWIYLQFEGGLEDCYEGGYVARFGLGWLLAGESTGHGEVPQWVKSR